MALWLVLNPMKTARCLLLLIAALSALSAAEKKPLTNADVIVMVKAGLPESTLVLAIENTPHEFDTSPTALIGLKNEGVSPSVLDAMLKPSVAAPEKLEPPTEQEVEMTLRKTAAAQSEGIASIHGFRKVDGQLSESASVAFYRMDFEVYVRFSEQCVWRNVHLDNALTFAVARRTKDDAPGVWGEFLFAANPGIRVPSGGVYLVKASATLERTEVGWKLVRVLHDGIDARPASEITAIQAEKNRERIRANATLTTEDFRKLVARTTSAPEQPDEPFESKNGKVTAVSPAGFSVQKGIGDVVGKFVSPGSSAERDSITLSLTWSGLLGGRPSLEKARQDTITAIEREYPGAIFSDPVKIRFAGLEGETLAVSYLEKGIVRQKAVTLAVKEKHVFGAILHSTPESFAASWDAYRRVCDSYAFHLK